MIIFENYRDKTNFHGNSIEILYHGVFFLRSCPQVTFTMSINKYGFGLSLPSCTTENFRVHPNGDFFIYRYREAGITIAIIFTSMSVSGTNEK